MIKQTALALASLVAGVSVQAQDAAAPAAEGSSLSVTVDVTYVSDYIFRGTKLGDASLQPSIEASYGNLYAGAWHTDELSSNTVNANETDFYVGYGFDLTEKLKLDGGVTAYTYNGGGSSDTIEGYVGASLDVILTPSLYYYYDFDLDVSTFEASIGYSLPIDAIKASLDLSGKLGYVTKGSTDESDYTYGVVGASVPFKLAENATFTVGVDYIVNDTEGKIDGDKDGLVGKAGISIGF